MFSMENLQYLLPFLLIAVYILKIGQNQPFTQSPVYTSIRGISSSIHLHLSQFGCVPTGQFLQTAFPLHESFSTIWFGRQGMQESWLGIYPVLHSHTLSLQIFLLGSVQCASPHIHSERKGKKVYCRYFLLDLYSLLLHFIFQWWQAFLYAAFTLQAPINDLASIKKMFLSLIIAVNFIRYLLLAFNNKDRKVC